MKTAVIYGSVRGARQGIKCARFVCRMFEKRGHEVTLVDPLEFDLPLLDKMYKEYESGQAPPAMERLAEIYRGSDAFVFVTAEYNHSVPPALLNLIDHFMGEFFWRPAGIVSYSAGSFGGVRAGVHLRAVLGEVGLITVPSMVPLSKVRDSFNEEGQDQTGNYERRIQKFIDELEWYAGALGAAREKGVPYS